MTLDGDLMGAPMRDTKIAGHRVRQAVSASVHPMLAWLLKCAGLLEANPSWQGTRPLMHSTHTRNQHYRDARPSESRSVLPRARCLVERTRHGPSSWGQLCR